MTRPTNPPDWATNANFSAGPYTGQANKAYAPAGNIGDGFAPGAGVPMEWLNERINNHGQWLKHHDSILADSGFHLTDEFFAGSANALDTHKWTVSGTATVPGDTVGNGAFSAVAFNAAGAGNDNAVSDSFPIGTGTDFTFAARFRLGAAVNGNTAGAFFGLNNFVYFSTPGAGFYVPPGNWFFAYAAGASTFNTALLMTDTTYHKVLVERKSGLLTLAIDGTQVFSVADATSAGGGGTKFIMGAQNTGTQGYLILDYVKVWVDR